MIRKVFSTIALLVLPLVGASAQQSAQPAAQQQPAPAQQQPTPAPPKTHLKVGQPAPDFSLRDTNGKEVKLSAFRGQKNVVLAFYVLAFTGG